jgi:hypothetical protein
MQFHINGRFLADIELEGDAWTVSRARAHLLPSQEVISLFAAQESNDIGSFLDELFQEHARLGQANPGDKA